MTNRLIHVTGVTKYSKTFSQVDEFDVSWTELVQELSEHERLTEKGEKAVIFGRFQHGPCACGDSKCPKQDHRIDANVLAVTALALDVDSGVRAVLNVLAKLGIRHAWYTTYTSTKASPRIRVVVDLSKDVDAKVWRSFWRKAMAYLGIANLIDTTCQNESRLFYLPCCALDAAPESASVEGQPLDVDMIMARPDPMPVRTYVASVATVPDWSTSTGPLSAEDETELLADLAALHRGPGRRATLKAVKLIFHDYGRGLEEGMIFASMWNYTCGDPYSLTDLERQVERIAEREGSNFQHSRGWACDMRAKFPGRFARQGGV